MREKEITNCNCLTVRCGTNCDMGGDSGHGGKTVIEIENDASTDWKIETKKDLGGTLEKFRLTLGGDTECDTIIEALDFIVYNLRGMRRQNRLK